MQRIGRYEIEGELGRGGMGVVYRAQDPAIGRTVAIKTIRLNELTTEPERAALRERLFREARSAGILSHPNIITIYDMGEENSIAYIAMEFVDGPTLEQVLGREGMLGPERIIPVLRQTAEALDYAARNGIVHRDIKPGNIMLAAEGKVKVADFGVAKILSQQITKTDVVMGTPSYMSPEQIESKPLDGRSDQFALGVIAYELLTGTKPFTAENMASLVFRIAREEPALVTQSNPSLSSSVDAVIRRALSKHPDSRFPNCIAFVDALADALGATPQWQPAARCGTGGSDTATESGSEPTAPVTPAAGPGPAVRPRRLDDSGVTEPPRRRRWTPWLLGAALAAGMALFFVRPGGEPVPAPVPTTPAPAAAPQQEPTPAEPKPSPVAPLPQTTPAPESAATPAPVPPQPVPTTATPTPAEPAAASVKFTTTPPGAAVSIEGETATCITPCSLELRPGPRVIRFRLAGHRMGQAIIEVPQEKEVSATLDPLIGTLVIKSVPPGALIFVDGQQRREVTPAILKLPAGKHKVVLRKAGSPDEEQDVEIKDQVITNMAVNWEQ